MDAKLLILVLMLGAVLALGCGDGDNSHEPTPTPADTAVPTDAPTEAFPPTSTPVPPTEPAAPGAPPAELDQDVTPVNEGVLDLTIAPRGASELDPLALAGEGAPPCAGLAFTFSWQVQDPYPADEVDLRVVGERQGAMEQLGAGPSGTATVGCFLITFANDSPFEIAVQVRYAAGSFGP